MPEIINALEDMDWQLPTPVQTEAIPLILGGGDVAVAAETGAGKTGAFCLPIVQIVHETRNTNLSKPSLSIPKEETEGPICLSSVDRGRVVAVNGIVAQSRHHAIWDGVRATRGVCRGKWYFVARVRDEGLTRFGWSSKNAQLNLGTDARGFGYGATAMKSHASKFDAYGRKFGMGDSICCLIEFVSHMGAGQDTVEISFLKNEEELGVAFKKQTSQLGSNNLVLHPAVAFRNAEVEVNFEEQCAKAEELGFRSMKYATDEDAKLSESAQPSGDVAMSAESGAVGEKGKAPLALILEPSRELAGQVREELKKFTSHLWPGSVRFVLLTGGGNPKVEKAALHSGRDIVAGTLGSVLSYVKKGTLSLDSIRFFVLDEADTFATDNLNDIMFLHQRVPARNRVQTLLFSATLHSPEIKQLSTRIQSFPTWVDLKGKETVPDTVHHTMVRLDADADLALLEIVPKSMEWPLDNVHLAGKTINKPMKKADDDAMDLEDASDVRSLTVKKLKLAALQRTIDAHNMPQAMIFVRTQVDADNVESFLIQCSGRTAAEVNSCRFKGRRDSGPEVEYSCAVLHGGKRQEQRNDALAAFKGGEVRFLVCTDVAARGIDIVGLPYLINLTLPDKSENYIHRVGRVGRAERLGLAVSLVAAQKEAVWYHTCNSKGRGSACKNRKLVSAGGCVIWQNEAKMLLEIEERLKGQIEELGADFRRKNAQAAPRVYGARIGEEEVNAETAKRIQLLQPTVRNLVKLEEEAQLSFIALQQQYPVGTS